MKRDIRKGDCVRVAPNSQRWIYVGGMWRRSLTLEIGTIALVMRRVTRTAHRDALLVVARLPHPIAVEASRCTVFRMDDEGDHG